MLFFLTIFFPACLFCTHFLITNFFSNSHNSQSYTLYPYGYRYIYNHYVDEMQKIYIYIFIYLFILYTVSMDHTLSFVEASFTITVAHSYRKNYYYYQNECFFNYVFHTMLSHNYYQNPKWCSSKSHECCQ